MGTFLLTVEGNSQVLTIVMNMFTFICFILMVNISHKFYVEAIDTKENPTWFIPSQEKTPGEDDQTFCTRELSLVDDLDLFQTRTSEILLPETLPQAICIIFPFAPNKLQYGQGSKGECHNGCCMFRPPSRNIPDPPPNPSWYETLSGECNEDNLAVNKPLIMRGKNDEDRTICVPDNDGVYSPVTGKTLACARHVVCFLHQTYKITKLL